MAALIPTLPLNDGRAIPAIGFGTGSVWKDKDAHTYVTQAIEGGFEHIDTAQIYHNEESVGIALREAMNGEQKKTIGDEKVDLEQQTVGRLRREDLWVTTKYNGVGGAEEALNASLKRLGLSYVDLYLIHHPLLVPDFIKAWSELELAQELGKARSIGVSNFNIEQLKLVLQHGKVIPAVNQIEFHPYNYHKQAELLGFANKHGIRVESYGGLTPVTKLPGGKLDSVLERIAKRLGPKVTSAQVIMSWIKAKGVAIVTTTSRRERIEEYLGMFSLPSLSWEDVAEIDEAGQYPPSGGLDLASRSAWKQSPLIVLVAIILFIVAICTLSMR